MTSFLVQFPDAVLEFDSGALFVRIWTDSLLVPAYVALLSATGLVLHCLVASLWAQRLWMQLTKGDAFQESSEEEIPANRNRTNIANDFSEHSNIHGGPVIFGFQLFRVLSCALLLAFYIFSAMIDEGSPLHLVILGKKGKRGRKHKDQDPHLSDKEWIDMALTMTSFYMLSLSVFIVSSTPKWAKTVSRHLNSLLLTTLAVYIYRDVYPLITFEGNPLDKSEGWVVWAKVVMLFLSGCLIPGIIPRVYTPVDPSDPVPLPNPEQTASLFSITFFSWLNPLISLGNNPPKLPSDLLPPLADTDKAKYLKALAFPHVDAFATTHNRHLFFRLMRIFGKEYALLTTMVIIQVAASFVSPFAIKNLLHYLETNGHDSAIKPWFWVASLFFGPLIWSLAIQRYISVGNRTLVQMEAIITQLVFEHSLRIRFKAEASEAREYSQAQPSASDVASTSENPRDSGESAVLHSQNTTEATIIEDSDGRKPSTSDEEFGASQVPTNSNGEGSSSAQNLIGKINNLVTSDLANITGAINFIYLVTYIPLQITLCVLFLYNVLGWSTFVGFGFMIVLFPVPGYAAKLVQEAQAARMKKTDARVQVVSETMNVLRMVKLFGWERKTNDRIAEKREDELLYIWRRQVQELVSDCFNFVLPVGTMITTYAAFTVLMKRDLTASIVFSSLAVFAILGQQLRNAFYHLNQTIAGKISLDRVNDFLNDTELLDEFTKPKELPVAAPPNPVDDIGFKAASFTWSRDTNGSLTPSKRNFVLRVEDELKFPSGQLSLVVGPTGSGKTSLLMALLGEMHYKPMSPHSWFNLSRSQGVAFAAQESWIQNETIKENILFGSPLDEERYNKVIYQCSLIHDLSLFEAGDQTEVGEKGLTLSGGQKARITLARAVYSRAKILLLDDVLAALDVHTGKWIVEKCFNGDLVKGRTVVLVTHHVALVSPVAKFVVSLNGDGKVVSQGPISEALKIDKELIEEFRADQELIKKADGKVDAQKEARETTNGKLIAEEDVEMGRVSWSALYTFLSALGGKHPFIFFAAYLVFTVFSDSSWAVQTWFLGYWASQYSIFPSSEVPVFSLLGIYACIMFTLVATYAIAQTIYIFGSLRASRALHQFLVQSVLGTTFRWLDTTPISRVLARCTQDIRAVDGPVASGLQRVLEMTFSMLVKFTAVVVLTPVFLFPGVGIALLGGWCGHIYIKAQLSVKREMSNAKAPVLGHFGAAIAGMTSIRAYGAQQAFIDRSLIHIDRYSKAARIFYNLNRWVCIRIDALGGLLSAGLATYLVYFQGQSASNTGFSLNMAVGFSSMILWWVRVLNDFEVNSNSLERIEKYTQIEQEPKPTERGIPPAYWPGDGNLHVQKLSARYSADGPEVLHEVSFDIQSGERIGIVGRTGSGKTSLTLALLRCIFTEGKVIYGGQDTSTLNLDALRSNIAIIPQMPELLSGTLRQNLDPFDQYDDATCNDALRSAGLFSLQEEVEEGKITLESTISSGGGNLSVGQRQIIALARAIIRRCKLLILDEATSAIDHKTDTVIQSSLRNELGKDVTILTVAHRLQTIMDADKIMVLDAGNIVEFDRPSELLKNPIGRLRALVDESDDKVGLLSMAGVTVVDDA